MRGIAVLIEDQAQIHHVLDALRCPRDGETHHVFGAKAGPRIDGVRDVIVETVVGMGHRGKAALGAIGGAAAKGVLGDHHHLGMRGQMQCRGETGGTAANNEHVCLVSIGQGRAPAL